ncbi:FMN-binding negative transcriptional regulator [Roseovarius faecimaris]|uniref:FMN-binding negative transcriptional regulator n=1 Tax=Roseovarius faecimaris TaxID=2494550 RepID=A0A6I6IK02_9RHOB|nr:FMN-binding negative transcriptional regulator [Roseovarius faecimaris]QGX97300.1 FMN-binding negative transcriptional regulator [Roseovarius faecimaris]
MHPNPVFRQNPDQRALDYARESAFGLLTTAPADEAPLVSHIPFLLSDDGRRAEFHLVRSNPIARALSERALSARLAVQGPHSYISPDWYGIADQVPTWNYIAVHLVGEISPQPQEVMRDLLDRQSAFFEERLRPKIPWKSAKMTPGVMEKMMRQIVPCVMQVESVHSTWKLNQNKPDAARLAAADHVDGYGIGQETALVAALMRAAMEESQ